MATQVSVMFICITWVVFEEKRKQRIILAIAFFSAMAAAVFTVVNAVGPRETWCHDNASESVQSDGGLCVVASVLARRLTNGCTCDC